MQILSLYLRNFRNYEEAFFSFSPGVNLIIGENGVGKTNLLEALYLLMTGRSFRSSHLSELIHFGKSDFYLEAQFVKNGISQTLKIYATGKEKRILHNFTPLPSLSTLFGIVQGVLFTPQDHELIRGHPACRREYLDLHISQATPLYLYHLTRYYRAMKQRNFLLKRRVERGLEVWEEEMAKAAAFVVQERLQAVTELERSATPIQRFLSNEKDSLSLHYHSSSLQAQENPISFYLGEWKRLRKRELEIGATLTGPHRDDIAIYLSAQAAKAYASEGQVRTLALSLRLSEWERLRSLGEEPPLLAIDDVGISLDEERERKLYSYLPRLGQVFLTSPKMLTGNFHTLHLAKSPPSPNLPVPNLVQNV